MAIISGDHDAPTRRLAAQLGMDRYFAEVLPQHKGDYVQLLQKEGHRVCFVGDGINDSIALKKADVSISLRGASYCYRHRSGGFHAGKFREAVCIR
jgi:P-type E1-E2 ATPase